MFPDHDQLLATRSTVDVTHVRKVRSSPHTFLVLQAVESLSGALGGRLTNSYTLLKGIDNRQSKETIDPTLSHTAYLLQV